MRRHIAGIVGWRRSGTIVRLLTAEWRARLARSAGLSAPSRRGVIGSALAGIGGWVLMSGSALALPTEGKPGMTPADPADVKAVLATASVQQAIRTWGPVEGEIYQASSGERPTLMLTHLRDGILTFVRSSPSALRGGNPAAVSLSEVPAVHAIRYYTVGGTPLADLTASSGQVQVGPVPSGAVVTGRTAEVVPDLGKAPIACFIGCVGRKVDAGCILDCLGCLSSIIFHQPNPIDCGECTFCAGQRGTECIEECGI